MATVTKEAEQKRLPGVEDARIDALEDAAESYAEVRDRRIAMGREESEWKERIINLLHGANKTHYARNGLEITLVPEGECVKVRIAKDEEE